MTAHELARILLRGPDVEVIISKDPEGNGFGHAGDPDYAKWDTAEREVLHPDDYPDYPEATDCVVLWPDY